MVVKLCLDRFVPVCYGDVHPEDRPVPPRARDVVISRKYGPWAGRVTRLNVFRHVPE